MNFNYSANITNRLVYLTRESQLVRGYVYEIEFRHYDSHTHITLTNEHEDIERVFGLIQSPYEPVCCYWRLDSIKNNKIKIRELPSGRYLF